MAVLRSRRGESEMDFLHNARELQLYTIRKCAHFPKRYTFYVGKPIADCSMRAYEHIKRANSIYPATKHEAEMRRDYFSFAIGELEGLISKLEIAAELFTISYDAMERWMELTDRELRLIKGVMKRDRERYRTLP